jgi:hypothetical protein
MARDGLRKNAMMAHLMDALNQGQDVGHYGRLVFAMVGRFFLDEDDIAAYLAKNPGIGEVQARALYREVQAHDYSPPKRERILEWQGRQDFPICPNPDDPNGCDVYRDLQFPDSVYEKIDEFYEQQVRADGGEGKTEELARPRSARRRA